MLLSIRSSLSSSSSSSSLGPSPFSLFQRFLFTLVLVLLWYSSSTRGGAALILNHFDKNGNKKAATTTKSSSSSGNRNIKISVCQNKDCCKRYNGKFTLVETLQDLLIHNNNAAASNNAANNNNCNTVEITPSGCLSQCGKGPNISVMNHDSKNSNKEIRGMTDASTVAYTLLKELNDDDDDEKDSSSSSRSVTIPTTLLAAVTVMEKSQQKGMTLEQQEKYLNSVIKTLQLPAKNNIGDGDDNLVDLSQSMALAHAYSLRAKTFFEQNNNDSLAKEDAAMAIQLYHPRSTSTTSSSSPSTAPWRILLDLEQRQLDKSRQNTKEDKTRIIQNMIQILQEWSKVNPSFRTKLNKEIQELLSLLPTNKR